MDETNDWYRRLGASHRRRDDSERLAARAIERRDNARRLAGLRRWPAIIGAMRALIASYNEGADSDVVSLDDGGTSRGGEPAATVTARGGRTLTMTLEEADLRVRASRDDDSRMGVERWVDLNRTDEATAAYVLQHWLAQLGDPRP